MISQKTHIQKRWKIIVALSLAFLLALMAQDVIREVILFNKTLSLFEQEFYRDVQDDVKDLVVTADKTIQFDIENTEETIINVAKDDLTRLTVTADAIAILHTLKPLTEIQADITEITQIYNNHNPINKYYIYDVSGVEILNGTSNTVTNIDVYMTTDYLNREYMKSLIDGVVASETHESVESFFVLEDDKIEEYYVYATQIEDVDFILAKYIKVSTFIESQIRNTIHSIEYINNNEENNVYILSGDGEILFHQNEDAIGLTIDDTEYPIWSETLRLIIDYAKTNKEGFLEYEFYSNYANGVLKDKVAYLKYIEEWDIVIGASSDVDIYDDIFSDYRADNTHSVLWIKIPAYIVILSLSTFMFLFIKNNVDLSQQILIEEEKLYRKFADLTSEIIMITDKHGEIVFTNKQGKQNIFGQRENQEKVFFDQILVEEEGYFILYGIKEDLYVKYITEEVEFNNEPADLYIIMDVTEKIRTERKLEALSMVDELTNLGNRRMMVKDYNGEILPFVKNGGIAHLAMIDLDDFKPANDIYGHSYGDKVLQDITKIFREESSKNAKFYRIGGDEFAIVFKHLERPEIEEFIIKLQQKIATHPYEKSVEIGFSAGVSRIQIDNNLRRFSDFFDRADKLLYKSKAEGKNIINF